MRGPVPRRRHPQGGYGAGDRGLGSIAARIAGKRWVGALVLLAWALSAAFFCSQFLWIAPGGRVRLPLAVGLAHVATPLVVPEFRYEVIASFRMGDECVWSLRHGRGRDPGERRAVYAVIQRPDGLYAATALLEHVRYRGAGPDGSDVDGLTQALEEGRGLPGNYQLLLPSRLSEGKSWRFGASRVSFVGKRTILTGYGLCRARVLRVACPRALGSVTLDMFFVHDLGVPRLTVRFPQATIGLERTLSVRVVLPGRRAKIVWSLLFFVFASGALAFLRRVRIRSAWRSYTDYSY